MSVQYQRADALWSSVTPATLSALAIDDIGSRPFRPTQWWDRPDEIKEQAIENDRAFIAYLQSPMIRAKYDLSSPLVGWRVARPADLWTRTAKAIAVADMPAPGSVGYIELEDSLIVRAGGTLQINDYDIELRMRTVDDDHSEGWTNDAGDACNCAVERLAGPAVAIPAGTIVHMSAYYMPELGVPSRGTTTVPGDPVWGNISITGIYGSISRLQDESTMVGGWGTHPKIRDEIYFQHQWAKQNALLFAHRYTGTDSETGSQLYISAGLRSQIKTHILEAGSLGTNLVGGELNDFLEGTFDSELSAPTKDVFCGPALFRDARAEAIQYGLEVESLGLQTGVQNPNALGTTAFVVTLRSGQQVTFHNLRKAFGAANMVDWGLVCDAKNIAMGAYKNIVEVWYNDIEDPAQRITKISDALIDTWLLAVFDESTCGVIRGGTRGLVTRG